MDWAKREGGYQALYEATFMMVNKLKLMIEVEEHHYSVSFVHLNCVVFVWLSEAWGRE
jgi:hypothetical protein